MRSQRTMFIFFQSADDALAVMDLHAAAGGVLAEQGGGGAQGVVVVPTVVEVQQRAAPLVVEEMKLVNTQRNPLVGET